MEETAEGQRRPGRRRSGASPIGCLGVVLIVIGFVVYVGVVEWRSAQRSAESPVDVLRAEYRNPWWSMRTDGYEVTYGYRAAGRTHEATDSYSLAYDPDEYEADDASYKACYDPDYPAEVQIEQAGFRCGEDWQHGF